MRYEQRATFRLPPAMADKLKLLAEQRGMSQGKLIRSILERYLDRVY